MIMGFDYHPSRVSQLPEVFKEWGFATPGSSDFFIWSNS